MFKKVLVVLVLNTLMGCKAEKVSFASAESTSYQAPQADPHNSDNQGSDVDSRPEQGPSIQISKKPQDHFLGESTSVEFRVLPGDNEITDIECRVDGFNLPCSLTTHLMALSGFDLGQHEFHIFVEDSHGLSANSAAQWLVSDRFFNIDESVFIEPAGNKADILFVIDNSGSMSDEQKEVARRISHFFTTIKKLDWRVGIITTDPYAINPDSGLPNLLADGALLAYPNGRYFLDSQMSINQARDQFAQTIYRPERGNGHERGIRNTYRAIQRSLYPQQDIRNQRLHDFFRTKASLSVVLISDEDETTKDGAGQLLSDQKMSQGSELTGYIHQVWGANKRFQFNSVIVRPGDNFCIDQFERFGVAYAQLSQRTGGVIEDICANDYSGVLKKIAAGVVNLQKVYKLKCQPQDIDGDGHLDFEVIKTQGMGSTPSYSIVGDQVEFRRPLSAGHYQFSYPCLKSVPN